MSAEQAWRQTGSKPLQIFASMAAFSFAIPASSRL
jgi:hypothetical protein